jgi:hypothetical protein
MHQILILNNSVYFISDKVIDSTYKGFIILRIKIELVENTKNYCALEINSRWLVILG